MVTFVLLNVTHTARLTNNNNTRKKKMIVKTQETKTVFRGLCDAARKCKVTEGHLSMVLRGRRTCSERLARKLEGLGVSRSELVLTKSKNQ